MVEGVPILLFNDASLAKCKLILGIRQESNLKHASILLPECVNDTHGYHLGCYRKFAALPKIHRHKLEVKSVGAIKAKPSPKTTRSRISSTTPSVRTGLFASVCIFCNNFRKKILGKEQKLLNAKTCNFEMRIRKYITWKNDKRLTARLQGVDFRVKEVKYHGCCRVKYQNEAIKIHRRNKSAPNERTEDNYWYTVREAHKKSFISLTAHIQDIVISNQEVASLKGIYQFYKHLMFEFGGDYAEEVAETRNWNLREKILKFFKDRVKIAKVGNDRAVYPSTLSKVEAHRKLSGNNRKEIENIRHLALLLRDGILKAHKRVLPDELKLKDIEQGEVDIPPMLLTFFEYLIGGPDIQRRNAPMKQIRIKSICQDSIFSATSGRKKPKKHLMLGVAIKSMTGSRKVIEVLNRLGHIASYHVLEEVETEITFEATKEHMATPHGMGVGPDYGTGVAWDNFDRFVETDSGKDTLHDTVGITYQALPTRVDSSIARADTTDSSTDLIENVNESVSRRKRRRSYVPHGLQIEPYRKKPRMVSSKLCSREDEKRKKYESRLPSFHEGWKMDILWSSGFLPCDQTPVPMWAGWNSLLIPKTGYIHKIWYLPQINESPTSRSVVAETMKRSLNIAAEGGRETIAVTYDLAIAKLAMQIQAEETPKYDAIFVALGAFHIEMAFFSALGKVVAESGGPDILNECEVLAGGSLKSFLHGKNYKRCRKMHDILSLSLEVLHFESFLTSIEDGEEVTILMNQERKAMQENCEASESNFSKRVDELLEKYWQFFQATKAGEHGKTAKFWIQYVEFLQLYHNFSRSVRNGDFDLYVSCLPRIANMFFALNHSNYSRWTVRYYDNLLKLETTHPEVYSDFKKGWFAVRRTRKSFSSTPIDLALEQTINADAASQRRGISYMTNSISARQRWAESHFLRTTIVSKVLDELGMAKKEDISKDLRNAQMINDNLNVRRVLSAIQDTMNPFHPDTEKECLYNLSTGKAASKGTENFLLNIDKIGEVERQKFTDECVKDPARFEERIQNQRLQTFATESGKKKLKAVDGKLIEACLIRDIFGSLLCYAVDNRIDISEVLKYPLSPVPLSICHVDGSMHKSQKSTLMKHLESKIKSDPPNTVDATIVDGVFFLHIHQNLPNTYGGVARYLLGRLMELEGREIHFVSDKWVEPSIKGDERQSRVMSSTAEIYTLRGASQKRPAKWLPALKSTSFKQCLIKFLVDYWADDSFANIIGDKVLFANSGNDCFKYTVSNGTVVKEEAVKFYSTHEEADNRMFFHLSMISPPSNVVVRTADTDCLIIALGCKHFYADNLKIYLEVGVLSNNSLRFIDINGLHSAIGETFCKALPAYHAFTGCDYTASFSRKGKVMPLKILEKDLRAQHTFAAIGIMNMDENAYQVFEQFVCRMYGQKGVSSVDDARTNIFFSKYRSTKNRPSFAKKLDGSAMPPCRRVLIEKVKRTGLVTRRWMSAALPHPPPEDPEQCGWRLEGTAYGIIWFEGDPAPKNFDICSEDDSAETFEGVYSFEFLDENNIIISFLFSEIIIETDQDSSDDESCDDED